jgi:parvulin-like peptidyl-prolyl isomerase
MAKQTKKRAPKELTRKQVSRIERDRRMERILKWSVTAVALVVVGVLAYGFIVETVVKARQAVATVGDASITTADFQARVRFTRMQMNSELLYLRQQQQALDPTDPEVQFYLEYLQNNVLDLESQLSAENALIIGEQALDQLIQEELVRQEAERRGITVSPDELQTAVEQSLGYERNPATPTPAPTATPSLTPTGELEPTSTPLPTPTPMTEQDFRQGYDNLIDGLKSLKISEQQWRSWFEVSLLLEKVQEQMREEVPVTAEQVKLRYLIVDNEELANEVSARLDAGEDFQAVSDELQEDEEVTVYGTELDWLPQSLLESRMNAEVADLAFSLEVGRHSQPVLDQDGAWYAIIEVLGREVRELDQDVRDQLGDEAFQEWLDAQQVLVVRGTYRDRVPTDP